MPKVVIYVRAEDARVIESAEGQAIDLWVRNLVRDEIAKWHARRSGSGHLFLVMPGREEEENDAV